MIRHIKAKFLRRGPLIGFAVETDDGNTLSVCMEHNPFWEGRITTKEFTVPRGQHIKDVLIVTDNLINVKYLTLVTNENIKFHIPDDSYLATSCATKSKSKHHYLTGISGKTLQTPAFGPRLGALTFHYETIDK